MSYIFVPESRPRLTKETAVDLGMFISYHFILLLSIKSINHSAITKHGKIYFDDKNWSTLDANVTITGRII